MNKRNSLCNRQVNCLQHVIKSKGMKIMIIFLTPSDKWKWGGDEWQKVYYRLVNTKYLV